MRSEVEDALFFPSKHFYYLELSLSSVISSSRLLEWPKFDLLDLGKTAIQLNPQYFMFDSL